MEVKVRGTAPDKGWAWFVMIASFCIHVVNGCFLYCVGIIHTALLSKFEEPVGYTSWAGAILLCLISSTGPFSSLMMNRFNCRVTIMTGGVILLLGLLISAFLPSLAWVILTYGIVGGIGSGLTYSASVVVIGLNFQKKRNIAAGVAVSGCAVGTFLFPPIITTIKDEYGYEGLFMILAGISFNQCLFGAICRPSYLENKRKSCKEEATSISENVLAHLRILKNGPLLFMCLSMFCWSIGVFMAFLHLPQYAEVKNSSTMQASWLIATAGIFGFASRILTGIAANSENISELLLYCGSFGMLGISTVLFPFYSFSFGGQLTYAIILGICSGNCYSIINSINIAIVGIKNLATAYGMEMFFCGIGTLIGPPIAGFIVDYGGTYELSFVIGASRVSTDRPSSDTLSKFTSLLSYLSGSTIASLYYSTITPAVTVSESHLTITIGISIILGAVFGTLIVCFKNGKDLHAAHKEATLETRLDDNAVKPNMSKENTDVGVGQDVQIG